MARNANKNFNSFFNEKINFLGRWWLYCISFLEATPKVKRLIEYKTLVRITFHFYSFITNILGVGEMLFIPCFLYDERIP